MTYHIKLDAQRHAAFLAEQRKDPITKESLHAGIEIVICANDKIAFIADNWTGQCPICRGTATLSYIPASSLPSQLGRSQPRPTTPTQFVEIHTSHPLIVAPMGFWGSIFIVALTGGGMGLFLSNNAFEFIWQNPLIVTAFFWSASLTAYLFAKRTSVAFFSQALMMTIIYGYENWVFILIVCSVLSWTLARLTKSRGVSIGILAISAICAELTYDFYGLIIWDWQWTFDELIPWIIGATLSALISIIVAKIFKKY